MFLYNKKDSKRRKMTANCLKMKSLKIESHSQYFVFSFAFRTYFHY